MKLPSLLTICSTCRGRGVVAGADGDPAVCPNCGGAGRAPMKVRRIPYDYSLPILAVPNGSTTPQSVDLQLDDDSYFEQTAWCVSAGAPRLTNPLLGNALYGLQITDISSGWQFSNGPIFHSNFASTALVPFPLLVPYIWAPLANVRLDLSFPLVGPNFNDFVSVVLKGYKLYAPDGSALVLKAAA